ncbi:MAG: hypothetical protein AAB338_01440 [Patescibacteria group bacterium]
MGKNFLFVCGDIGGASMMVSVVHSLQSAGHNIKFVVDGEGVGYQVLLGVRISFEVQFEPTSSGSFHIPADEADLVFISTCASTNKIGKAYARAFRGVKPVVFGADGFFNHGYKWREDEADFWFAINEAHAEAIRSLRPQLDSGRVRVVGQPAFDSLMEFIPRKEQIRNEQRQALGIGENKKMFLWFSQGMPEVIEEDLEMMAEGIKLLEPLAPYSVFIPRVHPKLDKLKSGWVEKIYGDFEHLCQLYGIQFIRADKIKGEELCLASDVILSITATDDIKNWMMGGPPVIHLMGPRVRQWFEKDLLLSPPFYLPDVKSGEALAVTSSEEWEKVLRQALDPSTCQLLREKWQAPREKATKKVARTLVELAF